MLFLQAKDSGQLDSLQALIARCAPLHGAVHARTGSTGVTVLMRAVERGQREDNLACVELLIDRGAAVNMQDDAGETVLMIAARHGDLPCMQLLIDKGGADVNLTRLDGYTALMIAAEGGFEDCVKLLLDRGVNVAARNRVGRTALFCCVHNGQAGCLKLLLDRGALPGDDVNERDSSGITALMDAANGNHIECLKELVRYRSKRRNLLYKQGTPSSSMHSSNGGKSTPPKPMKLTKKQ